MATVDELKLKVGVDGASQFDALNQRLDELNKNAQRNTASLNQIRGGVQNVAYQVQDLAVQISMGTSAFIALGQQLPQLLSGFGTYGAVIGAIAAVSIPLMNAGLKAMGFDMRSLNETTKALTDATGQLRNAQQLNGTSMGMLSAQYGTLSKDAQEFFAIQQQLLTTKFQSDFEAQLKNINGELATATQMATDFGKTRFIPFADIGASIYQLQGFFKRQSLGLTVEQARELSQRLKEVDASNPEKAFQTIKGISQYLNESIPAGSEFRKTFESTIQPLLETNMAILKAKENLKASAELARDLNISMLGIASKFQPDINAAKRSFDEIRAIRLEGEQRITEYQRQLQEKTLQDGVNREKELAAFKTRVNQDVNDKILQIRRNQEETYKASELTNKAKTNQIGLETEILKLRQNTEQYSISEIQLEEEKRKNALDYQQALIGIGEQLRKNQITASQAANLEIQALNNRNSADVKAQEAFNLRQKEIERANQRAVSLERDINDTLRSQISFNEQNVSLSDRERGNRQKIRDLEIERDRKLKEVSYMTDLTVQQRAERENQINEIYNQRIAITKQQQASDATLMQNFEAGFTRAYANYAEASKNAFAQAEKLFQGVTQSLEDNLTQSLAKGKLQYKEFFLDIVQMLIRSNIQSLIAQIFGGAAGAGRLSTTASIFKGLLGFANGGIIPTNEPVIVGEKGPELLVGASGNRVIPNNQLGGTNVTYNINAVDAMSFKSMLAADPTFLYAVTEQGRRRLPGVA